MKYTQNRVNNTLTITFKMDNNEWAAFDKRAYEQNKGKYNVPGFRKGHVPKTSLNKGTVKDFLKMRFILPRKNIMATFWIKIKGRTRRPPRNRR